MVLISYVVIICPCLGISFSASVESLDKVGNGNISLIDIGDCQSWNIVVTGEERGRMWFFTDVGIQPCVPNRGFLSWFEYWLDGNENYFGEF